MTTHPGFEVSWQQARELAHNAATISKVIQVPLPQAGGMVLAQDVHALPGCRHADVHGGSRLVGELPQRDLPGLRHDQADSGRQPGEPPGHRRHGR